PRPWTVARGRGGVGQVLLVMRLRRLGVGDADQVPRALVVAEERVVIDVPRLGLANGRVVEEAKGAGGDGRLRAELTRRRPGARRRRDAAGGHTCATTVLLCYQSPKLHQETPV